MATYSDIGQQQRKHTALRTKAEHYRRMALAIQANTLARHTFPKYVPRGKPVEWYYTQAKKFEHQSEVAGVMAGALVDLKHQEYLDAITPERAADSIEGCFNALDYMVEHMACDWPKLVAKLSTDQRQAYKSHLTRLLGQLITLLS